MMEEILHFLLCDGLKILFTFRQTWKRMICADINMKLE